MDPYAIPRKVNRHVIKAVFYLTHKEDYEFAPLEEVKAQARYTMRNLNPIADLDKAIENSLKNMTDLEILVQHEKGYVLNRKKQ